MQNKTTKLLNPKTEAVTESCGSIPIELRISTETSGQITREGQQINQTLKRIRTQDMVAGARLYHMVDHQLYMIVKAELPILTIMRTSDQTKHVATSKQIKKLCYLYTEHSCD